MDKICKYYKYQKYVSYDNGTTWQPLDEYQRGELIQFNSEDCGGGIGVLYKWEVISGDYECVGYDKYEKTQKYVSYDNGVTYSAVTPSEYGIGGLIQRNSEDCGYMPSPTGETKWIAKYQSGFTESATTTSPIRIKSALCSAIPEHHIGYHEIPSCLDCGGIGASEENYFIREVKIGDCVDFKIVDDAFMGDWYELLTSVTISNTVKWIGFNAFQGCKRLNNVTIPNSVTRIDGNAFNGCNSFTNIVIPDSVKTVGPYEEQGEPTTEGIFAYCNGLTSCTLSRTMKKIPPSMFRGCKSLTSVGGIGSGASVEIPSNITKISEEAFYICDGITSVTIPNTVSELGGSVFEGCDNLRNVSLPNSITDISDSTFNDCSSLANIIIPNSVTRIGNSAFYYCNLSSINIPSGVTFIGYEAFARNSGMTSITVNAITPPTLGSKAFDYTNNCPIYVPCDSVSSYINSWGSLSARIRGIEPCNLEIMVYVTYIDGSRDDYVKYCDDTDTSIYIPDADSAETVTYGDCVTSIDNQAFANRYNLKSVTISNSVTSIGNRAFYGCDGLTSVQLGDSLISIGDYAFSGCSKAFTSLELKNGVRVGNYAFAKCGTLTSATIDTNSIGSDVFRDCTALNSINIGSSTTTISDYMFTNCYSLRSVTIPDSVTSIGYYAFGYCKDISSITINAVTPPTLREGAFYGIYNYIIYVPSGSLEAYKSASEWSGYADRIQPIPNS